jgi:acetyl-CoA acetyltransferase
MLPKVQAVTVSRACASANQAITDAADQIALGHVSVAIAGGAESLSTFRSSILTASPTRSFPLLAPRASGAE